MSSILSDDVLFLFLKKVDTASFCKMRRTSSRINNMVVKYRNQLAKQREDQLKITLKISKSQFSLSVNGTILASPIDQLCGLNVAKVEISRMDTSIDDHVLLNLFKTLGTVCPIKQTDSSSTKPQMCGILSSIGGAEVTFKCGMPKAIVSKFTEELSSVQQLYGLPPVITAECFGDFGLPENLHLIWTNVKQPECDHLLLIPRAVYAFDLPSDHSLIIFDHRTTRPFPTPQRGFITFHHVVHIVKMAVVKKTAVAVNMAVRNIISEDPACAEIQKNISKCIVDYMKN